MKKTLSKDLSRRGIVLYTITVVLCIAFYFLTIREHLMYCEELSILPSIMGLVMIVGLVIVYYRFVIIPLIKVRRTFENYNLGIGSEDIYNMEYSLCSEMQETMQKLNKTLDSQEAMKIATKQAEYLALQNQINPHFLYNTLEAIRGDAIKEGVESIANITEALALFFRYTISNVESSVMLEYEITNVINYFNIQRYRFGDKINLEIEYPEDHSVLEYMIPKLTFQPIVENAIFHGLECKIGVGTIKVSFNTTQSRLIINIKDDGVGMDSDRLLEVNERLNSFKARDKKGDSQTLGGIAIVNVNERIKLLFGHEYGLRITSLVDFGTDVEITLPLRKG